MKVLQIFNRYLEYGGEEGSVQRIAEALREHMDLNTFYGSTAELLKQPLGKLRMPLLMQKNPRSIDALKSLQQDQSFNFWQIHNVFPAISVAAYELADSLGVPVIQYLHNYRLGCLGATYYRQGAPCRDCRPMNNAPGIRHNCWRGSKIASMAMAAALDRIWSRESVAKIKGFIAISQAQRKAHAEMGIPAEKISVIPHFLEASTKPGPTNHEGDVLYIGRLSEEKGLQLLIKSWSRINPGNRKLHIVGDGPDMFELGLLCEELELSNVVFHGFIPRNEQAHIWDQCAFSVAPSIWSEPFGMVILEAWRQGKPVLATNLGSFPELITDGVNGWLSNPDVKAFSTRLQMALDSGKQMASMGMAGYHDLKSNYNQLVWTENILNFYRKHDLETQSL